MTVKTCVYALVIDGFIHRCHPDVRGVRFTLVSAMQAAAGTYNCRVVEQIAGGAWRTVVDRAGSTHDARHVATGHKFLRRSASPLADCDRFGTWNRGRAYELLLRRLGFDVREVEDVTGGDVSFAEVTQLGCVS